MRAIVIAVMVAAAAGAKDAKAGADVYSVAVSSGHGRLGLQIVGITNELKAFFGAKDGVLVGAVEKGSPAEQAGVKVGDVVEGVEGKPVDDVGDIWRQIGGKKKGELVVLQVVREHRPLVLTARMADDAASGAGGWSVPAGPQWTVPGTFGFGMLDDAWARQLDERLRRLEDEVQRLHGAH